MTGTFIEMSNNVLHEGRTINSFLAAKAKEIRQKQISGLDQQVAEVCGRGGNEITFIKYWGGANKDHADEYDLHALLVLFAFLRVVEKHYKVRAQLTMIFTDSHVALNGYPSDCYKRYYAEIRQALNKFHYSHMLMSEVLGPFLRDNKIKDIHALVDLIIMQTSENTIPDHFQRKDSFERLKRSAARHSRRFYDRQSFGELLNFNTCDEAACAYIALNQVERDCIMKRFPQTIFLTYMSDEERELIAPDMPIVQLYSYRRGIRSRPWFSNFKETTV